MRDHLIRDIFSLLCSLSNNIDTSLQHIFGFLNTSLAFSVTSSTLDYNDVDDAIGGGDNDVVEEDANNDVVEEDANNDIVEEDGNNDDNIGLDVKDDDNLNIEEDFSEAFIWLEVKKGDLTLSSLGNDDFKRLLIFILSLLLPLIKRTTYNYFEIFGLNAF